MATAVLLPMPLVVLDPQFGLAAALLEAAQVGAPRVGARHVLEDELEARACAG